MDEKKAELPPELQAEILLWDRIDSALLDGKIVACPKCGNSELQAQWSLYSRLPRAASFDAWCPACGVRHHAAVLLPPGVADNKGSSHAGGIVDKIFKIGKKQGWW